MQLSFSLNAHSGPSTLWHLECLQSSGFPPGKRRGSRGQTPHPTRCVAPAVTLGLPCDAARPASPQGTHLFCLLTKTLKGRGLFHTPTPQLWELSVSSWLAYTLFKTVSKLGAVKVWGAALLTPRATRSHQLQLVALSGSRHLLAAGTAAQLQPAGRRLGGCPAAAAQPSAGGGTTLPDHKRTRHTGTRFARQLPSAAPPDSVTECHPELLGGREFG